MGTLGNHIGFLLGGPYRDPAGLSRDLGEPYGDPGEPYRDLG